MGLTSVIHPNTGHRDRLMVQHAFHAGRVLLSAILAVGLAQGRLSSAGWWSVVVVACAVAAIALAIRHLISREHVQSTVRTDVLFVGIDMVLALGVITLLSDGSAPLAWVALVIPVAEAALVFNFGTAIAVWGVISLCHLAWVFSVDPDVGSRDDSLLYALQQMLAVLLLAFPASVLASSMRGQLSRLAKANSQASRDTQALRTVSATAVRMSGMTTTEEVFKACVEGVVELGFAGAEIVAAQDDRGWSFVARCARLDRPSVEATVLAQDAASDGTEVELLGDTEDNRQLLHVFDAGFAFAVPLNTPGFGGVPVLRVWAEPGDKPENFDLDALRLLASQTAKVNSTVHATEVVERRAEKLAFQASHDPLTALANRRSILQSLAEMVDDEEQTAVFFIDLNGFKAINDSLGHETGDHVLVVLAKRLSNVVGERGRVGRLGGDEFVVVGPSALCATEDHPFGLALEMLDSISEPMEINKTNLTVGASIGAAISEDSVSSHDLLKRADAAMYRAKQAGSPLEVWEPELHDQTAEVRS